MHSPFKSRRSCKIFETWKCLFTNMFGLEILLNTVIKLDLMITLSFHCFHPVFHGVWTHYNNNLTILRRQIVLSPPPSFLVKREASSHLPPKNDFNWTIILTIYRTMDTKRRRMRGKLKIWDASEFKPDIKPPNTQIYTDIKGRKCVYFLREITFVI